jgi:hypothetical protein
VTISEKTGKQEGVRSLTVLSRQTLKASVMEFGLQHDIRTIAVFSALGIDRSRGFKLATQRTLEKRPFPLLAYIAYTVLHCTILHACDKVPRQALLSL